MSFGNNRDNRPGIHIHIGGGNRTTYDDGGAHVPWSEKTFGQKLLAVFVGIFAIVVIGAMIYLGIRFFKSREEISQTTTTVQNSVHYAKILLALKGF